MVSMFDLTGKKAIVTGGNRGLGKGIVEGLCEAGAQVAIIASGESVMEAAEELRKKGYAAAGYRCDLSDDGQLESTFEQIVTDFGGHLDILVNNAGIQRRSHCEDFALEDWDAVLTVNLRSVFRLCQLAGRKMLASGGGKIINLASMLSFFGGYTVPAYAAAKGGVAQLTKALSNEWASHNIQVNAIAPGYMATEMNTKLIEDPGRNKEILSRIPAGRWGTPEDMKGLAVFLAGSGSNYLNGAVIPVDGGYLGR